jgi:hypothetical protein
MVNGNIIENKILRNTLQNKPSELIKINSNLTVNASLFEEKISFIKVLITYTIVSPILYVKNQTNGYYNSIGLGISNKNNKMSLLSLLKSNKLIDNLGFGFILNNKQQGELIFGEIPKSYIKNKYMLILPVIKEKEHWGIKLSSFFISRPVLELEGDNTYAMFNVSHRYIKIPKNVFEFLENNYLKNYILNKVCRKLEGTFYCDDVAIKTFPNITIRIGVNELNLTRDEIFVSEINKKRMVIEENIDNPKIWSLGTVLLKKYISYFNNEKYEIVLFSDYPFTLNDNNNIKYKKYIYSNDYDMRMYCCWFIILLSIIGIILLSNAKLLKIHFLN